MAAQVSDVVGGWFDLPDEVIHDLLFNDFNEDIPPKVKEASVAESRRPTINIDMVLGSLDMDNPPDLSHYGLELLEKWLDIMNNTGNPEAIVVEFPKVCSDPLIFTIGADNRLIASQFLHNIMTKITEFSFSTTNEPDLVSSSVTARENDILEYIAGYTLRKASTKFSDSVAIFEQLTAEKACGELIPIMERKAGALKYPSMDLLFLLRRIYRDFSKECSKAPANIDFTSLNKHVAESSYFHNFIMSVHRAIGYTEETQTNLEYMASLFIRVCGHSFAKKLFEKLRPGKAPTKGTQGTRGDLQGKPSI